MLDRVTHRTIKEWNRRKKLIPSQSPSLPWNFSMWQRIWMGDSINTTCCWPGLLKLTFDSYEWRVCSLPHPKPSGICIVQEKMNNGDLQGRFSATTDFLMMSHDKLPRKLWVFSKHNMKRSICVPTTLLRALILKL